jgi:thiamine biosynthesis lipoprotein
MTGRPTSTPTDPAASTASVATRSMRAIGTTVWVAVCAGADSGDGADTDDGAGADRRADEALALLAEDLRLLDEACSRFSDDSEIRQVERDSGGRPVPVSPLLFDILEVACVVAVETAGTVDPTVGSAVAALGYDRDFALIGTHRSVVDDEPRPAPGWWRIRLDPDDRTVAVPPGVSIDVGSTAKALAADRSAARIAAELGCGVLVNLGGDVSVTGPCPPGGWSVGIAPRCTAPVDTVDQVVAITGGAVATSGTTARTWLRHGEPVHHIVDPWTGDAAVPVWALVSTAAPTCVEANAWSTAAVVWGADAPGNLGAREVPARLVTPSGDIVCIGGWPSPVRSGRHGEAA